MLFVLEPITETIQFRKHLVFEDLSLTLLCVQRGSKSCPYIMFICVLKKWGGGGSIDKWDCGGLQDDRFSGDLGVFAGWEQFVLLARSVHQHGIADWCLSSVNSSCGNELSRHDLKYWLHQLHPLPWQPCNEMEHYAFVKWLSSMRIWQYLTIWFLVALCLLLGIMLIGLVRKLWTLKRTFI